MIVKLCKHKEKCLAWPIILQNTVSMHIVFVRLYNNTLIHVKESQLVIYLFSWIVWNFTTNIIIIRIIIIHNNIQNINNVVSLSSNKRFTSVCLSVCQRWVFPQRAAPEEFKVASRLVERDAPKTLVTCLVWPEVTHTRTHTSAETAEKSSIDANKLRFQGGFNNFYLQST